MAFLLTLGWAFHKGWIVIGQTHDDLQKRYDRLAERFDRVVDEATEGTRLSALLAGKVANTSAIQRTQAKAAVLRRKRRIAR